MKVNKTKRLVADVDIELHAALKAQCAYRNMSLQQYMIAAIIEKMARDKKLQ